MQIDFGKIKFTKKQCFIALISISLLEVTLLLYYFPSRTVRNEYINNIINVKGETISKILIEPRSNDIYSGSILRKPFYIKDKDEILKFCALVNESIKFAPNHPGTKWNCVVTLYSENKKIKFEVSQKYKKGFYIYIYSEVTSGWAFGSYRNEELGKFINKLIKRSNLKPRQL